MFGVSKSLGLAIIFLLISGIGHLGAPLIGGFVDESVQLVPFGVISILIVWGLMRNWRWLAWLTFFFTIFSVSAALSNALGVTKLPVWLHWMFVGTNGLAFLMLLIYLWLPKPAKAA